MKKVLVIALSSLLLPTSLNFLSANDTAVEVSAGGIIPKQEGRVVLSSEKLYVSQEKIRVDYEFINMTDRALTIEVGFPVPIYKYTGHEYPYVGFDDFSVYSGGDKLHYEVEVKALLNGKDVTNLLESAHLTIRDFAGYQDELNGSELSKLSTDNIERLAKLGILASKEEGYTPRWDVALTYHWRQSFPPNAPVHISHEYRPVVGFGALSVDEIEHVNPVVGHAESGCPDEAIRRALSRAVRDKPVSDIITTADGPEAFRTSWVRYILTTANSWNGPIRDFELIVKRRPGELVTFCWDAPVEKIGPDTFRSRLKNFRPERELTIYFVER